MNAIDLDRLEQQAQLGRQLVLALGQNPQILEQTERGELHPVMLAYGLWKDEEDLATLADEITANRQTQFSRPALEL